MLQRVCLQFSAMVHSVWLSCLLKQRHFGSTASKLSTVLCYLVVQIFSPNCQELHGPKEVSWLSRELRTQCLQIKVPLVYMVLVLTSPRDPASCSKCSCLDYQCIVRFMHYMGCWEKVYSLKPSDEIFSRNGGNDDEYSCPHQTHWFSLKHPVLVWCCASRRKGCAVSFAQLAEGSR